MFYSINIYMKKIFNFVRKHKSKILFILPTSICAFSLLPIVNLQNIIGYNSNDNIDINNSRKSTKANQPTYIANQFNLTGEDEYFKEKTGLTKNYNQIHASQHFGNTWVGIDINSSKYQYNIDADNNLCLKKLVLKTITNIPDETQYDYLTNDTYLEILNYYLDNFTGQIVVKIKLNVYYNGAAQLIDTVKNPGINESLIETIEFSGFKTSQETIISNSISVNNVNGTLVDDYNILDYQDISKFNDIMAEFSKTIVNNINLQSSDWNQEQIKYNTTTYAAYGNKIDPIIAYPGLKQLRTNIGVKNFFKKQYVDIQTFEIYDKPANGNETYRQEIGSFCFGENTNSSLENLRTLSLNYNSNSERKTTYVKETEYQIVPSFASNSTPSQFIKSPKFNNILDNLFVPATDLLQNPITSGDQVESSIQIVTNETSALANGYIDDLNGKLTIDVKVSGKYYFLGQKLTSNSNDKRIFTIVITGFSTIQATTIDSEISIKDLALNNYYASNFQTSNLQLLKELLISGYKDRNVGFISPTSTIENFIANDIEFVEYLRDKNNTRYLGIPNNVTGELVLTIKVKSYYNDKNGLLVNANSFNDPNCLVLTTKIKDFDKIEDIDSQPGIITGDAGIYISGFQDVIPSEAFSHLTTNQIKNLIYDHVISGNKTNDLKNNIIFSDNDKKLSLDDPKTSNLDGQLNLYFKISGLLDKNDGIEITEESQFSVIVIGFRAIKKTQLLKEVPLQFSDFEKRIFAVDLLKSPNDWKNKFKEILIQRVSSNQLLNIKNMFSSEDCIPREIITQLIENSTASSAQLSTIFDKYFEIYPLEDSDNQFASQDGSITIKIGLKMYYNEAGQLIRANNDSIYDIQTVRFTNLLVAKQTVVTNSVDLKSELQSKFVSDIYNPYDHNNSESKIIDLIFNNKTKFFTNVPNIFFDQYSESNKTFRVDNINVDSINGTISFNIILIKNYFNSSNTFVESPNEQVFTTTISGFKQTSPTVIIPIIKVDSLVDEKGSKLSTNLLDFTSKDGSNSPTNNLDVDYLYNIFKTNIEQFITYTYPLQGITDFKNNYLVIESPVVDFSSAIISFDLKLNYYYDVKGLPVTKENIDNNTAKPMTQNIKIIGFKRNSKTDVTNGPLNVKNLDQTLANISVKNLVSQNGSQLLDILKLNPELLSLIFTNLPTTYSSAEYVDDNLTIKEIVETNVANECKITFTLRNVFIEKDNKIILGNVDLVKSFNGFLEQSETALINTNWDLSPNLLSPYKIAYWKEADLIETLVPFLNNNQNILEKYINNLVYEDNGLLRSKLNFDYTENRGKNKINAKNGEVTVWLTISPYYNADGTLNNGEKPINFTIRNFSKQNPTEINQSIIYTSQLNQNSLNSSNGDVDPIFGNKIMSEWFNDSNSSASCNAHSNLTNILVNNGGQELIKLMLFNTSASSNSGVSSDMSNTIIESCKIFEYDDVEGSITFEVKFQNFFDEDGRWRDYTTNLNHAKFTIYQKNRTIPTNLTKVEASVDELKKYYDQELYGTSIPLNSSLNASEFYKAIVDERNFINFESFFQSLASQSVYGVSAINPPSEQFKPLTINVWNDNELEGQSGSYKNLISYDDTEGSVSIHVSYSNVYTDTITSLGTCGITGTFLSLVDTSPQNGVKLKIVGFKQDTSQSDLTLIISIVCGSIGVLVIIGLLSLFLYKRARQI